LVKGWFNKTAAIICTKRQGKSIQSEKSIYLTNMYMFAFTANQSKMQWFAGRK